LPAGQLGEDEKERLLRMDTKKKRRLGFLLPRMAGILRHHMKQCWLLSWRSPGFISRSVPESLQFSLLD